MILINKNDDLFVYAFSDNMWQQYLTNKDSSGRVALIIKLKLKQ